MRGTEKGLLSGLLVLFEGKVKSGLLFSFVIFSNSLGRWP